MRAVNFEVTLAYTVFGFEALGNMKEGFGSAHLRYCNIK